MAKLPFNIPIKTMIAEIHRQEMEYEMKVRFTQNPLSEAEIVEIEGYVNDFVYRFIASVGLDGWKLVHLQVDDGNNSPAITHVMIFQRRMTHADVRKDNDDESNTG